MIGKIAYFSAEWGLSDKLPIYAGGLGVLAADILKEASDQNFPMIGIGLLYHAGFFKQKIDESGNQIEENFKIDMPGAGLSEVIDPKTGQPLLIEVDFPVEPAAVKVWQKQIGNASLFLLDADLPINKPFEQNYTAHLYEGAWSPFLEQEILLGVGGIRLLRTLKLPISKYHLNDDHAAFSILERSREKVAQGILFNRACAQIKRETIFTTHTPVSTAESKYPIDFIWPYLATLFKKTLLDKKVSREALLAMGGLNLPNREDFSLSVLALNNSFKVNAVSKRHQQTSKKIWHFAFPQIKDEKAIPIDCVTNAVHAPTWIAKPLDKFYKKYLGENYQEQIGDSTLWSEFNRRYCNCDRGYNIPHTDQQSRQTNQDLWHARLKCKSELWDFVKNQSNLQLPISKFQPPTSNLQPLFLGFARRFAPYKRVCLLISDLDRLSKILTHKDYPAYLFIAGKAHPKDGIGKNYLKEIFAAAKDPCLQGHLILLENYNLELAKILTAGVDVWLNTPLPPLEASGTSGMKAALNGVLNASVADGWWYEAGNNEVGWMIGPKDPALPQVFGKSDEANDQQTAAVLYDLLETQIVPLYYDQTDGIPLRWIEKIKKSLITLAPQFNTQRLLKEYQERLYK